MSTLKIWDLHLKYDGLVTQEFMDGNTSLAKSIAEEEGIIWKIWTHEEGTPHFGSTYLFKNKEYLMKYREMHIKRLNRIGITEITDHVFDVLEDLSKINNAPLS